MLGLFLVLFLGSSGVVGQPAVVQYEDCFTGPATAQKLNVSTVYAQVIQEPSGHARLDFTLFGTTPQRILKSSGDPTNDVASKFAISVLIASKRLTGSYDLKLLCLQRRRC